MTGLIEPLDPERRAAVEAAIMRDPVPTFRQIADECGVGTTTVQRIAQDMGVRDRWANRTRLTAEATDTNRATNAARRAALEERLLETADDLLDRLHHDVTHVLGSMTGPEKVTAPAGPREWRDTMTAVGTASKAATDLARLAQEGANAGRAKGLLNAFWEALESEEDDEDEDEDGEQPEDTEAPAADG